MIKVFQIDFVRAIFEWQLQNNYKTNQNDNFSKDDVALFSFYEHLVNNEEINRYVETYKEMNEEMNRQNKIGYGIVATSTTPTFTNLYSAFISPFEWSAKIRTTMANRDKMLSTIYNLIYELKGRKVDIASLHCYDENDNYVGEKLFAVGTIEEMIESGDYIGTLATNDSVGVSALTDSILAKLDLVGYNFRNDFVVYATDTNGNLTRWLFEDGLWLNDTTNEYDFDNDDVPDSIIYNIPKHKGFDKMKVDFAFDDIVCDEPYTLDTEEYCDITFGGSSTLCTSNILLGNDMVRLAIGKDKIVTSNDNTDNILFRNAVNKIDYTFLEPLDISSALNGNSVNNFLRSNFFLANSNVDSVNGTLQYSFPLDTSNKLIKQWFNYSRYFITNTPNGVISNDSVTPNIIYSIKEYWNTWGEIEIREIKGKVFGDITIENSESDTLTLSISFQIQGENN